MLEQKIDIYIEQQERSSQELKDAMSKLTVSINELIVSNTKAEERHHYTTLRLAKAEENIEKLENKLDDKLETMSPQVIKNSLITSLIWSIVSAGLLYFLFKS